MQKTQVTKRLHEYEKIYSKDIELTEQQSKDTAVNPTLGNTVKKISKEEIQVSNKSDDKNQE